MSDIDPTTVVEQPGGTDGNPPAATPPSSPTPATDDKTVTLSETDYKNLVAARDRANNANSDLEDSVTDILKEREINKFLIFSKLNNNTGKCLKGIYGKTNNIRKPFETNNKGRSL